MSQLLPLLLCLFLGACASPASSDESLAAVRLQNNEGGQLEFRVEVADDAAEQQQGLMFRETLPAGRGMLFVFSQEQPLSFWMKNTKIPLDIAFFAADGRFVSETTMVPCEKDPCPTYPSEGPAKYALEVNVGELAGARLNAEWKLVLP